MILSDSEIKTAIRTKQLAIQPLGRSDALTQRAWTCALTAA